MNKHRVYISSTYRDLKDHRKCLLDFFNTVHVRERFEVTSMEGYVADNVEPSLACMEDVKKCDIYILILANRYGFQLPANDPTGISITETEYNTAVADPQKIILAYFANEANPYFEKDADPDTAIVSAKQEKLAGFKKRVREKYLSHPEPFDGAHHLVVQVAQSLMKDEYIDVNFDSSIIYCCDRIPQYSHYLLGMTHDPFKTFVIYGSRKELSANLINRLKLFTLGLPESMLQNQVISFEEFLVSETYEKNRNALLAYFFRRNIGGMLPEPFQPEAFLDGYADSPYPIVFTITGEAAMFTEKQFSFCRDFIREMHGLTAQRLKDRVYLFLSFEVTEEGGQAFQGRAEQLGSALGDAGQNFHILPMLESFRRPALQNWLTVYITPQAGVVEDLLEARFDDLPAPYTMRAAEKRIRELINDINSNKDNIQQQLLK